VTRIADNFLYVSSRPQWADARPHQRTGRAALHSASLRSGRGPWLGAHTRQRVPPQTVEGSSTTAPEDARCGRLPAAVAQAVCRVAEVWGSASPRQQSWEVRSGTARVKGASGVASDRASSPPDPRRPEPQGGSYRGAAENCMRARRYIPHRSQAREWRAHPCPAQRGPVRTSQLLIQQLESMMSA
jgi:hypothetical protein